MTYRSKISAWVMKLLEPAPVRVPVGAAPAILEPAYEEKIAALVTASMGRRRISAPEVSPTAELLSALGCRSMDTHRVDGLSIAYTPPVECEDLVRDTLMAVLTRHFDIKGRRVDAFALLEGLTKNNRWHSCLKSKESALALARLLVVFTGGVRAGGRFNSHIPLREVALPGVCKLLNEWVQPPTPFHEPFSQMQLARVFFGDAWCAIVMGGSTESWGVGEMIATHRPQFLPALLPVEPEIDAEPLPALGL